MHDWDTPVAVLGQLRSALLRKLRELPTLSHQPIEPRRRSVRYAWCWPLRQTVGGM